VFRPTLASGTVLVVGGLGGAFQLRDPATASTVWSRLGSNLPHGLVLDLRYNDRADVLIAGILGRGAWTLKHALAGGAAAVWENAAAAGTALEAAAGVAAPMALPATLPKAAPRARLGAGPSATAKR
jgi:hypothetical protein